MDHTAVQQWLDNYIQAWMTYEPQQISDLFSADANYYFGPYHEPVQGREAIVANWLENRDAPGTYAAQYRPLAVEGNTAIANGRSIYYQSDSKTVLREFNNIFLLRFDDDGRCKEFMDWYMQKPKES